MVKNPSTGAEVRKVQHTWLANMVPNSILENNTKWPEGTKPTWAGNDGSTKLTFDKAGESKIGDVTITLPSGSSYTVKDITVISKANVIAKSETVDYGTTLTAADLVTNKNVFPEGTTYQFVDNSEPTWGTAGSYNNVKITATYKDASGASVTTPVANCAVAINDSRSIKVLVGSDVPSVDSVLNLPSTWEEHTASWTTSPNTNSTNEGVITIHYPASNLDQQIKVYVTVIPKTTAVDGQNFFTNGEKYDGTTGSIANGNNQGAILTQANGQAIDYTTYSGQKRPGEQTVYDTKTTSYTPTYSLSGLETNSDGSLVSDVQTATVRVSVPKGTIGAKVDADGNYYYELNAKVNIAQPVTFEFVDEYKNDQVVGQTYSQEFIPGVATNLNFNMAMPDGYELGNGASIPSQYTLAAFSQTTPVVQVPIHQKMHFYITFHDEDSNTNLGTVEVSGSAAGNGGYDPYVVSQLKFPDGANATNYQSISTSGVPEGVTLFGDGWKSLTDPKTSWWIPNYKWENTFSVLKALTGATMTINLKHRISTTQERQTRTATVNYVKAQVNADGTYTQDGSAAQSAVLEVYYSRNKYQDQVTKVITYSPWLWDTSQGQNGYHVVSGNWTSLPTSWGAVVADVPTVDGYTAAVITDKSNQPANEFVHPTWNTAGAGGNTDPAQASQAYTKNATVYEAQPVHTVLYIPVEQQKRTVTAHMKYADAGSLTGQDVFPDEQINLIYQRTGSLDPQTNKISYGNWTWATNAGNKNTPGFEVVSGNDWANLGSEGHPQTGSWRFNAPNKQGYTTVTHAQDGNYNTEWKGQPTSTSFTNGTNTDYYWAYRNDFTVYYVPNSELSKTVTRTINITEPGKATQTVTQTATISRNSYLNNNDNGVVYSDWSTGNWSAQNVPTHEGYTMSATQTVNGVTTPLTLVNGQVPAETVTGTTQNTTINITWGAVATATLTGNGESTYNGQAITNGELNNGIHVTVTGPTASSGTYTLQNGDVEFSTDGTTWSTSMPINAGKYQVRLTTQGETGIKNQFGNNSIVWTSDGKSTITSNATYTIKQANVTTELSGNNSMTYNGSAVTTNDLYSQDSTIKVVINGTDITNLPQTFELKEGDYVWQTTDGQAPKDVGNYQIKLTATGINHIQKQINDALGEGNVALTTTADDAGTANFEIKQAVAENVQLYGNEQSPYDGHVVTFDPTNPEVKNNFGFHNVEGLTIPNFTSADFDWYDASGKNKINAPTNAGHYVLKLNDQGKQALADANKNYTFVDQNGKSTISGQITYVVTPAELVVKVTGKASKVYNNQNAKITQDQINQGDIKLVWGNSTTEPTDLGEFTLTPDDLEVVDASGQAAIHANYVDGQQTGDTYYVRLTADALAKIKQLSGAANYNISQATDTATYQIYAHKAELTLTGNQTTAYGTELPFNESKYTLDFTNWVNTNIPKPVITWQNGEMLINGQQPEDGYSYHTGDLYVEGYPDGGVPTNAGSYKVKISANLTKELQKIFPDYDFSGNVDSSTLNSNKTVNNDPVEASHEPASYVITPAEATITINGAQHVKYGESTAIAGDQYTASVTAPVSGNKTNVVTDVALTSDDLTTVPSNAGVGSYTIKLTPAGLAKIQAAIIGHGDVTKNYGWTQADNATANFFVEQMPVTIAVSGQSSVTYGTQDWLNAIKVNPSGYVLTITTENGAALSYHTVDGDLVFNQTPGNVGEYQVELSAQGLANIEEKLGTNYSYPQTAADVTAKGTFTVKQGEVTVTLNGSDGKTYNAVPTLSSGLNLDKYNVTYSATVYSADGKAQTLTLTANDLQIIGDATNVGTYQVKLSEIGQEKLKALTGNQSANYKWAFNTNADYVVKAATASAELSGSNQKTFDGTAVTTVEVNSNGQILVHFTFPGSTIQSTYALQNGDYTWSTADGNAPTNVGTYTISLNKQAILDHLQNALNTQAGLGDNDQSNVTISADDLSGQARFTINPQTLTDVTISAPDQSKTYDAQAADLDVNGITITANGIVDNNPLVNPGISASDFTWYDGTGNKLESAPVDVGTYKARLNASTLAELQNANSNYQFSSVAGLIKYTINPAPATATISGSADRDYNAQTTSVSDVMNKIMWNTTGLVTNQDLNLTGLTANSYAWYSKDADGNYVAMTGNPVNAGTYYLRLTKDAIAQVKADNSNYNFTSVDGEFTYTINVVNGTATLRGSSSKTYDGQAATTAEVNSTNGDIIVNFAFPGSSAQSTYALQAGDYIWENKDGQEISAPTNAGTYTIKLSADGITNLQNAINQYAGQRNVTLDAQDLLGAAVYTIKQKTLNVILGNNGTGTDGKTYDGQPAVINTQAENFGVFTTSGLVNGENLNAANLTNNDYEWVDANGNAISAPTNAGTYYISLTANGLKKLQADNPNYAISESGQFTYVISPAEENVTISGSQESTSTSIDNANFTVHAPAGITVPTGMTYEFATGVPSESGVYVIKLTPESIAALEKTNPNYKLNISSDARFTLDATLSIEFEDTQDGNKQVGKTITKTGVANSTINDLKLVVPDNYELAPDQELPTSYTFGKTLNQNLYIKLVHKLNELNPTDPSTNPDPTNKNWFRENGLVKDVARTINYEGLSTAQLAQIPETQKAQTVEFTRTAKYDLVTGKIVVNSEGSWTAVDGKDIFAGFTPFAFAGYTAAPAKVEQVKVTGNDKNSQITVTYTANNQTGKISYVDSDGKEVGQTTISGKTGETVKVTPEAPTGWIIVAGQDIPETVVATPTGVPTVVVKVTHSTITVTPETPEKDIPTGPVPGDPSKNYEKMESLTASPTRTIVVTDPSGRTTKVTQTVNFTRTATFDEVTGEITYSDWTSSEPAEWSEYTAPEVAGYTATQMVKSQAVSAETKNETVSISYTANNQTGKISYVDSDGKEVGQTTISGKTGETVKVTPEAPTGWIIVAGQDIPKSVTATATGIPTVTVKVEHSTTIVTPETPEKDIPTGPVPGDPSKNYEKMESLTASPTRTIVVTDPSGRTTKVTQTVNFTRTATFDEVTGEITYSNWASSEPAEWSQYAAPEVAGYTATQMVKSQVVSAETADETIRISYTANTQTGKISYVDSNGKEVGQTALTGKTGQSVAVTPEAPTGWIIVAGQDIPKSVTATATGIPTVTVKVEHSTTIVTPETPEKDIPTGPVPGDPSKNYEKMESLTASPTRTIVVTDPSGRTTKVTQTVNFTRTATFDEVTGEITYSNWASSEPTEWSEYTAPEVAGYTATSSVSAKPVTAETKNETVSISYTANNQTGKISYVDGDGKEVGQTTISGKTGETVNVTPQVPSGWKIVPGQDIPKTITIRENGIPTVTVKVEHSTIIVTPETPEKDIPTGPVPGDPSKDYEKMESLTATPTRTIVVTDPSGKTAKVTQTVNFTITATFDEVTGEVTYSDWQLEKSTSANHTAQWDSYTPQFITHYVPSIAEVPAEEVNANTADRQVTITYTPASESQVIRYVDQNDKEISTQIVSGKYGLDTTFTPKLPNNWQAANTIPTSIKIGENGGLTTIVVEAKTEKVQQAKTVTETIHYHTANDKQLFADKEMEVNFFRTGVKNLVTGEITWNNWNKDKESFNEVPSPKVSGYTASPAKVAAQTVTPNSEDLVFNVIYTKNSQTHPTIPENKPNKPQEEKVSKQETKTQDKLIHEYGYKKRADGRLVDHTGHVYPASSKVKENGAIYSEKGELLSVGSRRKHELPQTGLHDNSLIAAIGSLLAGISIFGLLGGRKKKDDDK